MKKRLLYLGMVLLTLSSQAQNRSFDQEATFWVKGQANKSAVHLNGHAPIENNESTVLTAPIGKDHSNYYLVYKSLDKENKDLVDFNFSCYKQTMTTQNINFHDENAKQQKIKTGAIVKQGFVYPALTDRQFLHVIEENDKTYVYEMIYINKEFQLQDHQKIQTYLSLKYGISLVEPANYFDESVGNLWQIKENHNEDITAIGRNDYYGLSTLSTTNSVQSNYSLASNSLSDNEYVFVGSSKGDWEIVENKQTKVIDKTFSIQTTTTRNLAFDFIINTNQLAGYDNESVLILYKNGNVNEPISFGKQVNDQVVFSLQSNDLSDHDEYTVGYASRFNSSEIVFSRDEIKVYPNPSKIGENVNIDFNLKNKSDVEVYVYQLDGKLIDRKKLGVVDVAQYSTSLNQSGTYVFAIITSSGTQVQKVVVE